jgi:uncharacterized protein GlcG (DUF336 family)
MSARARAAAIAAIALLAGCGGGGGGGGGGGAAPAAPTMPTAGTTVTAAPTSTIPVVTGPNLTQADVTRAILQAANEAAARGRAATIAVVDRVGNVLMVHQMAGAAATTNVNGGRGITGGLEGANVPSTLAAIAKAVSGAFLSSAGNAFSTRTASNIVQDHFYPLTRNTEGGPLFGVQFSQLPCSDVNRAFSAGSMVGPKRSPLGLSADPGGFPLYKNGLPVGGIGVVADGTYGLDLDVSDFDRNDDEIIAIAGTSGFDAPTDIRANLISIGGLTLRYSDVGTSDLRATVSAPGNLNPVAVAGYFDGTLRDGTVFGTVASGVRPDDGSIFGTRIQAYVLDTGAGQLLFPPRAGLAPAGSAIGRQNAIDMVREGLVTAYAARAAIRRPQGSFVNLTVSVVDLDGNILASGSTNDPPVFGIDVSVQKARSAMFFSRPQAQADLSAASAAVRAYVAPIRSLLGANGFADGIAFTSRAIGNLARPYYPDGIDGTGPGPLSLAIAQWSPFKTGLQLDLVAGDVVGLLGGGAAPAVGCAGAASGGLSAALTGGRTRLANGLQIFAGGVPIYSGTTLVGGIGVSGDGIDQDDMVAFLGLQNGGGALFTHAPSAQRSDQLTPGGTRLRYVNCPFSPFLNSTVQNPC